MNRLLLLWFLVSCGANPGQIPEDKPRKVPNIVAPKYPTSLQCQGDYVESYEHFAKGFFLNYCIDCHSVQYEEQDRFGAPLNIDFNTHRQILLYRVRILDQLSRKPTLMPPDRVINADDLNRILQWLRCGAP